MINTIKKILGMEHEISNKLFLKALSLYPYLLNGNHSYKANITNVWVTKKKGNITVHIKTHYPGILIGKQGSTISGIRELMETYIGQTVTIDIQEETMFDSENWRN